jgi:hypothetical protein
MTASQGDSDTGFGSPLPSKDDSALRPPSHQAWQSQALAQQGFAPGASNSNVQSKPLSGVQETSPTLSHRVRTLPQSHTANMVTKKRDRSPSTTPMPTTEPAQNDGSHLTGAQWEGMQKVLNHIYDYRTEECVSCVFFYTRM